MYAMTTVSRDRHIVAMGGGGFSQEPDNPLLDRYILGLARDDHPAVCFLPTASGDAAGYIERFHAAFAPLPCTPTHLSLFDPPTPDLRSFVLAQDVVYVGGGNTRNMLVLWREWGLDRILREAWEGGIVLAGLSAGAICWFEQGVTDSVRPGSLIAIAGLGFLPGSACPHYDGEEGRRPNYHRLVEGGALGAGYAADDGVALHFVDRRLAHIVSSRPKAWAYRVEKVGAAVREAPLRPRYLAKMPEQG